MPSQSAGLPWQYPHYTESQSVSKILFPRNSIKEPIKAQCDAIFLATDQTLVRAATGVPGRQGKSHAGRPKGFCSRFPIWVGFPSFSQVSSKRSWNMPTSSQLHKYPFSLHPALDVFSHLDRTSRTYRSSHLHMSILTFPWHSLGASQIAAPLLLQPCYSPGLQGWWNRETTRKGERANS